MPWRNVKSTLEEERKKVAWDNLSALLGSLLLRVSTEDIKNLSVKGKKTEILANVKGWKWFKSFGIGMTTKLEEKEMETFYEKVPDFLRKTENGNLNILISKPLSLKRKITYTISFAPGYVFEKNFHRDHSYSKNLVAIASYPEAYPGKELDGFWVREKIDEDLFTKYMRLKGEAERLGFITSVIRPKENKCKAFVCIEPWEMEKEEFINFTKNLMEREGTKELTITDSKVGYKFKPIYEYKATVYPYSKNVEMAIISKDYTSSVSKLFFESLDLFSVELEGNEKVTYEEFYETEGYLTETLEEIGSKFSKAVKTPFISLKKGFEKVGNAIGEKWNEYKMKKERETEEIIEELRSSGIPPNVDRIGSCYIAYDRACLLNEIKKKKTKN